MATLAGGLRRAEWRKKLPGGPRGTSHLSDCHHGLHLGRHAEGLTEWWSSQGGKQQAQP